MWCDCVGRVGDEAEIGLVIFVERRRDADDDRVHRGKLGIVGGRGKSAGLRRLDFFWSDAVDVRTAFGQRPNLSRVNVEPGDPKLLFAVEQRQRQADVSQADDAHAGFAFLDFGGKLIDQGVCGRGIRHDYSCVK